MVKLHLKSYLIIYNLSVGEKRTYFRLKQNSSGYGSQDVVQPGIDTQTDSSGETRDGEMENMADIVLTLESNSDTEPSVKDGSCVDDQSGIDPETSGEVVEQTNENCDSDNSVLPTPHGLQRDREMKNLSDSVSTIKTNSDTEPIVKDESCDDNQTGVGLETSKEVVEQTNENCESDKSAASTLDEQQRDKKMESDSNTEPSVKAGSCDDVQSGVDPENSEQVTEQTTELCNSDIKHSVVSTFDPLDTRLTKKECSKKYLSSTSSDNYRVEISEIEERERKESVCPHLYSQKSTTSTHNEVNIVETETDCADNSPDSYRPESAYKIEVSVHVSSVSIQCLPYPIYAA